VEEAGALAGADELELLDELDEDAVEELVGVLTGSGSVRPSQLI
jgi:hypothetical protein